MGKDALEGARIDSCFETITEIREKLIQIHFCKGLDKVRKALYWQYIVSIKQFYKYNRDTYVYVSVTARYNRYDRKRSYKTAMKGNSPV